MFVLRSGRREGGSNILSSAVCIFFSFSFLMLVGWLVGLGSFFGEGGGGDKGGRGGRINGRGMGIFFPFFFLSFCWLGLVLICSLFFSCGRGGRRA